uniref:Uncharacterized protein n=1 Tax=Sphaerodactylus townsendi TaxID=933632 RepID=A0ACB8EIF9_9SAUR
MAGVSFGANRLELLASYQEVIAEDSPTDCSLSPEGQIPVKVQHAQQCLTSGAISHYCFLTNMASFQMRAFTC